MRSTKQPPLQTVERALNFLECVAGRESPPTVQQVASELGLNITTCYHLMRTLIGRGYLERRPDLTLTLGASVGALFNQYRRSFNVSEKLFALVTDLARKSDETAFFSTLETNNRVILKVLVEGSQPLRVSGLYVGLTGGEYIRAAGKAVLAHLSPEQQREMVLKDLGEYTKAQQQDLFAALDQEFEVIRSQGWAEDAQESSLGISAIGSPVFDKDGKVYGAVGIVAPTSRMDSSHSERVQEVLEAARQATALLSV
ncbi:IclR family transcriptional regulator [Allosalinactinospora lopnorensis]|uniref:IclR family transcriptional regulator n=1 Tax=Allosalinactinospora lopnorensis TaxID=1352348 RepID=UPI000623F89F|nr:IclR family transcriptional regulator [Allosalinactinospora lopnorensis]